MLNSKQNARKITGDTVYIVIVNIQVKENLVDEFIRETIKNVQGSRQEIEVSSFDFLQNNEDPTQFLLIEAYHNEASVAKHQLTLHYISWRETVKNMMEQPRIKMAYRDVFPQEVE